MKECYYSILGVDRRAEEDDIKKAYRQMALKHHPDKQAEGEREQATARFQLISEAYEVLSNKQERAWYDGHREQILRGSEDAGSKAGFHSTKQDIWQYFSTSCFGGKYDDSEGGFYKTYNSLFEELSQLERDEFEESDSEEDHLLSSFPSFGDSRTEWEDVQTFYTQWSNFQSSRRFSGFDKWNLREGENRQIRRAMEVENKKARSSARKEFSGAVRSLVAFVRRRDKRVIDYQTKAAETERLAKEQLEKQKRNLEERKRMAREQARMDELKRWEEIERLKLESGQVSDSSSGSATSTREFFCVACKKTFKSEKAYVNHEASRKHKQEVQRLRQELLLSEDEEHGKVEALSEVPETKKNRKSRKKKGRCMSDDHSEVSVAEPAPQVIAEESQITPGAPARKPRRRKDKQEISNPFSCKTCHEGFQSKSALFRHLDESGHHIIVSR
jgi:DnaJ family protein A protein 5